MALLTLGKSCGMIPSSLRSCGGARLCLHFQRLHCDYRVSNGKIVSPVFLATNQSPYFLSKTGTLPLVYNRLTLFFVYKPTFCFVYKAAPSLLTTVYSNTIFQCTVSLTSLTSKVQSDLGLEQPLYVSRPYLIPCRGTRSHHVTACLLQIKCAVFLLLKVVCKLEQST